MMEHNFSFTNLRPEVDICMKDESQQAGTPAHAFQLSFLKKDGLAANYGDHNQTKIAVDSSNTSLKNLVEDIESRDPGIRCRALRFVSHRGWSGQVCKHLDLDIGINEDAGSCLLTLLHHVLNVDANLPATVDIEAGRDDPYPQLTLSASLRNPEFLYGLYVAAEYDDMVDCQVSIDGNCEHIELGALPANHDSLRNLDREWPQIVLLHPYGFAQHPSFNSHKFNLLAIFAHLCFHRGDQYTVTQKLGAVISHRLLHDEVVLHFDRRCPQGFSGARLKHENQVFIPDLTVSMLTNIKRSLGKNIQDEVTLHDICWIFQNSPGVVKDFVGVSTAMSAVGSQRLDVVLYRSRPGAFVDKDDQGVVSSSRNQGHLYIYCNLNRVTRMLARMLSMIIRCCPVVYFAAEVWHSVEDRATQMEFLTRPTTVLRCSHVVDILRDASKSWKSVPLAIAVSVTTDDGIQYTRLLLARPFTPNFTSSCRAPYGFWVDGYTTWCWETEGPSKASSLDLDQAPWRLRPRFPNWVFLIGRRVVALTRHDQVLHSRSFHMHIAQWSRNGSHRFQSESGSTIKSVAVCIMPAHVFPTFRSWQPDSILGLMSQELIPVAEAMTTDEEATSEIEDDAAEEVEPQEDTTLLIYDHSSGPHNECFTEATVNAHFLASHLFDQIKNDINVDLNEKQALGLYLGYSVDTDWCMTTFRVEDLVVSLTRAKLACLLQQIDTDADRQRESVDTVLRQVSDTMLSDDFLLDVMARFFSDVVSSLGSMPPIWWGEVHWPGSWTLYRSVDFMKYQLCLALRNMDNERTPLRTDSLFYLTRKDVQISHRSGQTVRMVDHVRMQMPAGMALYLRHVLLQEITPQPNEYMPGFSSAPSDKGSRIFTVRDPGPGRLIQLHVKPDIVSDRFSVYQESPFLRKLVLSGVNEQVLTHLGGTCHPIGINFLSLAPCEPFRDDRTVNCNVLQAHFCDFREFGVDQYVAAAAKTIGPSKHSLWLYFRMVKSALRMSDHFKLQQRQYWDLQAYVDAGMPVKQLSSPDFKIRDPVPRRACVMLACLLCFSCDVLSMDNGKLTTAIVEVSLLFFKVSHDIRIADNRI